MQQPATEEDRIKQEQQQKKAMEEAEEKRRALLSQILEQDARERLNRIFLVKPERARAFEDYAIKLAQGGKLQGKINEDLLVKMLEQMSGSGSTKVKIQRKKSSFDSDDEDKDDEDEDDDDDDDDFFK